MTTSPRTAATASKRFGVRFGLAANDIVHPRIPRQQGRLAQQALRGLRPADELAPSLGAHLG